MQMIYALQQSISFESIENRLTEVQIPTHLGQPLWHCASLRNTVPHSVHGLALPQP